MLLGLRVLWESRETGNLYIRFDEGEGGEPPLYSTVISDRYRNRRKRFGLRFNLIAGIHNFEIRLLEPKFMLMRGDQ